MVGKEAVGLNLVQELAGRGREPPTRFVQSEENRPIGVHPLADGVPVVDLHRLCQLDGDDEANRLKTALTEWGLFHVLSDELPASFLNEVQSVAKKFFHLPIEEKLKYGNITVEGEFKYEGYGNDRVATEDQKIDWHDRLYLLVQPESERNLQLWPDNPSSFRSVLHEFSMKSRKMADNVLRAIAMLLELEENYFTEQLGDNAGVYARFNYYPSCPRSDAVIGMKPHSDSSVITILLLDNDVDGLEVLKDGEWFSVSTVPHALLVFLGDQMEIMSNGIFKSPVHRVVTNSQKERISVVLFYSVNDEEYIEPANSLVDDARPKLYKKIVVKDYMCVFFETFAQGKRAIDFTKI